MNRKRALAAASFVLVLGGASVIVAQPRLPGPHGSTPGYWILGGPGHNNSEYCTGRRVTGTDASTGRRKTIRCATTKKVRKCRNGKKPRHFKVTRKEGRDTCRGGAQGRGKAGVVTCGNNRDNGWLFYDVDNGTEDLCVKTGWVQQFGCKRPWRWDRQRATCVQTKDVHEINRIAGGKKP